MKTLSGALAWLLAGAIVFWTLGPVADRPQSGHPQAERFAAFFVLAVCWALAYPRRPWVVLAAWNSVRAWFQAAILACPTAPPRSRARLAA